MSGQMQGKVIAITGASRGMGRAFATLLASEGAKVLALARPSDELDSLAAELGGSVLTIACDISDAQAVTRAINEGARHFGRLDGLINNAAGVYITKVEAATDEQVQRQYGANLFGSIYATRAAIPHLRAAGGGDIIFMSSESVRMAFPYLTLYMSSKTAIEGFAMGLRQELRAQGTRVTVLRSGAVDTGMISQGWTEEQSRDFMTDALRSGCLTFSGQNASVESMAKALLAVITLPRDINVDLIEPRARAPLPD